MTPPIEPTKNTQHTGGPWFVAGDDANGQAIVRSNHIEIATCWHHCVGSIEQEMRANARLIASAPELLEALKDALPGLERLATEETRTLKDAPRVAPGMVRRAVNARSVYAAARAAILRAESR